MKRAVFLDRDSTLNEPIYFEELGILDSPLTLEQFKMIPKAAEAVKILNDLGFFISLATNQPAVAKGKVTVEALDKIHKKMNEELAKADAKIDAIYYCPHSTKGIIPELTKECDCRKPGAGLITKSAEENDLDMKNSYMIGDSWRDMAAGKAAGCITIMVGHIGSCDYCRFLQEKNAKPDHMAKDLYEAALLIKKLEESN